MKNCLYLLLFVFSITSCTEDVKFNNTAFQGLKNKVFWRAQSYTAYTKTDGSLVIEGQLGFEKVTLQLPSAEPQLYILGIDDIKTASYSTVFLNETSEFTTGPKGGDGQVVITEFNKETNTISGTFKFTALNKDKEDFEKPSVIFTEGVFYKIPYSPVLSSK